MKKKILISVLACIELCLIGCGGPRKLTVDAVDVEVTNYTPKSCVFLGNITNENVHENLDIRTSLAEARADEIAFLKNEGAKRGANVIVLSFHNAKGLPPQYRGGIPGQIIIYKHSVSANAYRCSPKIISQLQQQGLMKLKVEEAPLFKKSSAD